jgi:hypothetical protein
MNAILARAQEMQAKLAELQQELGRRTVEASAGGGMVTVVASGALRVLEVRIEKSLTQGGDHAMLQDLVAAAVNAALTRAQQMVQEEMQRAAGGTLLRGLGGLGGPGESGPAGTGTSGA